MNHDNEEDTGRLFIVANRLPISIKQTVDGSFEYGKSSGGLASSLAGLSQKVDFQWFGWPGIDIHRNDKDEIRKKLKDDFGAVPVFLPASTVKKHYNGFSNSVLWPLLHRMPEKASTDVTWSEAYEEVNEIFADVLLPYLEDGDSVWIHDYHLLLLPTALRKRLRKKRIKLGFFLHTPFPTEDFFSILPFREAICKGLFECDVVGFHTRDYVEDFLDSAQKVLPGVDRSPNDLHYQDRKIIVHEFPIGIDPDSFRSAIQDDATQEELRVLTSTFSEQKILISVDRLDYIKGIPQKLLAYDQLLSEHPELIGKVVLIQLAIPTRPGVEEYIKLQHEVESLVGRVNGRHSTMQWTPLIYLHRSLPFPKLCALYAGADVCIVSSIRDGLNLVSYEFIAAQGSKASGSDSKSPGVLLLSQYTGAKTMLKSSLTFNPWDTQRFSEAILRALEMDASERRQRYKEAAEVVDTHTSMQWGTRFLNVLETLKVKDDEEPAGPQKKTQQ